MRFVKIKGEGCDGECHLPSEAMKGEDKMAKVKKDMVIDGMMCMHCSARVEAALKALPGVDATIDLEAKTAHIECDSSVSDDALASAVTNAGYTVVSITAAS